MYSVAEVESLLKMTFLTSVTPFDPRFKFDPIVYIEGLKLINMYESFCATWTKNGNFTENYLLTQVTPNDPK